jgi:AmmeMemoRadiSam system protein B
MSAHDVTNLRPSPISGRWYEADPVALARAVDAYMDRARPPELQGELIAVVAPHAGHLYSGPVAGFAFAPLRGLSPDLVAVVGPYHNFHPDSLLTSPHDAYSTPLGEVPVDLAGVEALDARLEAEGHARLTPVAHDPEHSLEIELPFLQRALAGDWKLLPVMVRTVSPRLSRDLGRALAAVLRGRKAILVASTDLSHYHDQPTALALDRAMLSQIESFNPEGAFDFQNSGQGYACGLGALTAVLWAARDLGADRVRVLNYATSGDVTGDMSAVVGYAAAAILKTS